MCLFLQMLSLIHIFSALALPIQKKSSLNLPSPTLDKFNSKNHIFRVKRDEKSSLLGNGGIPLSLSGGTILGNVFGGIPASDSITNPVNGLPVEISDSVPKTDSVTGLLGEIPASVSKTDSVNGLLGGGSASASITDSASDVLGGIAPNMAIIDSVNDILGGSAPDITSINSASGLLGDSTPDIDIIDSVNGLLSGNPGSTLSDTSLNGLGSTLSDFKPASLSDISIPVTDSKTDLRGGSDAPIVPSNDVLPAVMTLPDNVPIPIVTQETNQIAGVL